MISLPLAGLFTWLHAIIPASASGLLEIVRPTYASLPFDIAVLVAPSGTHESSSSSAPNADYQVLLKTGTQLPCSETLEFFPSVPEQTIHKTAFYIGYEGAERVG